MLKHSQLGEKGLANHEAILPKVSALIFSTFFTCGLSASIQLWSMG
jgi:hypothetical protein